VTDAHRASSSDDATAPHVPVADELTGDSSTAGSRRLAGQVRIVGSGLLGASIGLRLRQHGVDVILDAVVDGRAQPRRRLRRRAGTCRG
jgi:prephenate dehydrogenase